MKLSEAVKYEGAHAITIRWVDRRYRISMKLGNITWHAVYVDAEVIDDQEKLSAEIIRLATFRELDFIRHHDGLRRGQVLAVEITVKGEQRLHVKWNDGTGNWVSSDEVIFA